MLSKNKKRTMQAVFFDWSGTLCDDYINVTQVINKYGLNTTGLSNFFYHRYLHWLRYTLSLWGVHFPEQLNNKHFNIYKSAPLHPHIPEVLSNIKQEGIFIAIMSTQSHFVISKILTKYYCTSLIDYIEGGIFHKGAAILRITNKLNFPRSQILYVSDLTDDIKEVRRCGILTCAVTWGYDKKDCLTTAYPSYIISNTKDLLDILK